MLPNLGYTEMMHCNVFKMTHVWEKGLMQMVTPLRNGFFKGLLEESLSKPSSSEVLKQEKSFTPHVWVSGHHLKRGEGRKLR